MMELLSNAISLLIGCAVGFVLGYISRSLREIKEELDEVVEQTHKRDEQGFMRIPLLADIMLFTVVVLTVWAAIASQTASNKVKDQQERIEVSIGCNQEYLNRTIDALNERTTFSTEQARANVALQRAQAEYLSILLLDPPASSERVRDALRQYFDKLTEFVELSTKSVDKAEQNPYPTPEELASCLANKE